MLDQKTKDFIEEIKQQRADEAAERQRRIDELNAAALADKAERIAHIKAGQEAFAEQRRQQAESEMREQARKAFMANKAMTESDFNRWYDEQGGRELVVTEFAKAELIKQDASKMQTLRSYLDRFSKL